MGKLHQLLAVESSVTGNFNRDVGETVKVFGRGDLFTRTVTSKNFFSDDDAHLNTVETKEITTTVKDRLDWFTKSVTEFVDLVLQKDTTNQRAVADLVVDGKLIAEKVPAVTLLMLESKIQEFRKVFESSPTLPSGISWEFDKAQSLWKNKEPRVTFSTKKTSKPVVLYEATDKHPAQVKEIVEDVPVAKITVDTYSGMLTSEEKAKLLGRLDKLLHAVKKARQQANDVDVSTDVMGSNIFDYLYDGVIQRG